MGDEVILLAQGPGAPRRTARILQPKLTPYRPVHPTRTAEGSGHRQGPAEGMAGAIRGTAAAEWCGVGEKQGLDEQGLRELT